MEVRTLLLAEYYDTDHTGKFFVGGGFNQVTADVYPARLEGDPKLILVLEGDYGDPEPEIRIEIRRKGASEALGSNPFSLPKEPMVPSVEFKQGTATFHTLRITLKDLVLDAPGQYFFDVYLDSVLARRLRLIAAQLESDHKDEDVQ